MGTEHEAGRSKAAVVSLAVRIGWLLVVTVCLYLTIPRVSPEKVNVKNLRGAAKHQAREQLTRQ